MVDIRVFIKNDTLYLYDRGLLRLYKPTNVMKVTYTKGIYLISYKEFSTLESSTGNIEKLIEFELRSSQNVKGYNRSEAETLIVDVMGATSPIADSSLNLISPKEDTVTNLMREIAMLSHADKTKLLVQILDLL